MPLPLPAAVRIPLDGSRSARYGRRGDVGRGGVGGVEGKKGEATCALRPVCVHSYAPWTNSLVESHELTSEIASFPYREIHTVC